MANAKTLRGSSQYLNSLDGQYATNALFAPRNADLRATPEMRAARAAKEASDPALDEKVRPKEVKANLFNIDSFRSEILNQGVLPTHSFILLMNDTGSGAANKMVALRCESVSIPGVNLLLQDVTRFGYGPITRMPHAAQYNTLTLNFIVDEQARIHKYFNDWTHKIINHKSRGGSEMNKATDNQMYPYQVGYKRQYAMAQMSLLVADRKENRVMECLFFDAFPIVVNDINLSWGEQDTPMRLSVTMSFTDVEFVYVQRDPTAENPTSYTSMIDPINEQPPSQARAKKSLLGKLINNVGKAAATSVIDGIIEDTERKVYNTLNRLF